VSVTELPVVECPACRHRWEFSEWWEVASKLAAGYRPGLVCPKCGTELEVDDVEFPPPIVEWRKAGG
jgi:uncharacterized protein YbaR (Trm112 family)